MTVEHKKYLKFDNKILMLGFGSIGKGVLPLILRHMDIKPEQIKIITKSTDGFEVAKEYGVELVLTSVTRENYQAIIDSNLSKGDFLLNLSVDVSSIALIKACQEKDVLYLDTCIEPWIGGYTDKNASESSRSNYGLRELALALRSNDSGKATAVLTHGANPGLVSHFVKQALVNIANDNGVEVNPVTREDWARLSSDLNVKVIHIAERDTQVAKLQKKTNEFVNTWSIDGFISEGMQPAELGWGTHEKHWPHDGNHHEIGEKNAIFLSRPGASTRVRTWTPNAGSFHGFLITHSEAISISDYFSVKEGEKVHYRPTVHYAYHPCEDAVLSVHELAGREWDEQSSKRLMSEEIIDGMDELGVLLMGSKRGAYWFGSMLTIHEARELAPHNTATSLQVAIGVLAGMIWAIQHPTEGVIEPEQMDYEFVMDIAKPYLGKLEGHYTDWTPIKDREKLFSETLDKSDPWQFVNIRVS